MKLRLTFSPRLELLPQCPPLTYPAFTRRDTAQL